VRADAVIQIRVAEATKTEWCEHADQHGVALSDFIRTACRLGALIGYRRLADGLTDIASSRRDLHAVAEQLRHIAADNPQLARDALRDALAQVHATTDVLSAIIRGKST
jgi:glycosyltransferase A (GT-A) superfamily protein (DUF2064 family)